MNITQAELRKMIAEAIEVRESTILGEGAEWAGPLIAMISPMMGYYLYHWFAKQGEPPTKPPRRRPPPPPGRPRHARGDRPEPLMRGNYFEGKLREGMEMPDLPADLLAQIPDSPRDISAGLYAELMKHLPGLDTNDLRAINDMIANLVAAKKAQG